MVGIRWTRRCVDDNFPRQPRSQPRHRRMRCQAEGTSMTNVELAAVSAARLAHEKRCRARSLVGMHEEISLTDLRMHLGEIMDEVALGKTFSVTRKGRVISILTTPTKKYLAKKIHK